MHSIEKQPNGSLDDGCGIALNMASVVESEHAVRTLDRVDTREDLTACLEQLSALRKISYGEACSWPCAVTRETVSRYFF